MTARRTLPVPGRRAFWIAAAVLLVLGVHPVLRVVLEAGCGGGAGFRGALADEGALEALGTTARLALATTALAVLIGTAVAWLGARTDLPGRRILGTILAVPYIVPPYIAAVAWINLANPEVGLFNAVLGRGTLDIYSFGGLTWVLALSFYPYVDLTVRAALQNADPALEDAARMSGAGTWRIFRDVALPLMAPAMATSGGLVFMATASAFGAPALIGAHARLDVLSTRIYESLALGPGGLRQASGLATLLLAFALVPLVLPARRYAVLGGKASRPGVVRLGRARVPLAAAAALFALVAVVLPALAVVGTAFLRIAGDFRPGNLTLENFAILARPDTARAVLLSLGLGAAAATAALALGGAVAAVVVRARLRGRGLLSAMASLPLAAPGTVLAIGLLLAWNRPVDLRNTAWILLVAYVAKHAALAARAIGEGLGTVDAALADAARLSGARLAFRIRSIWIPLVLPSLVAAWFLVFLPSFSELTMSVILAGPGLDTIGTRMFELQEYEGPAAASVLATVVLGFVVLANSGLRLLTRGRFGL